MPYEIRIPRLGWSMEEGTFVRWLKQSGQEVQVEEPLFELEGEKALQEIPSVEAGTLHVLPNAPADGTVVAVGTLIGYLLLAGESLETIAAVPVKPAQADATTTPQKTQRQPEITIPAARETGSQLAPAAPPSVRRLARQMGVSVSEIAGTGGLGRVTSRDVGQHRNGGTTRRSQVASPRARRVAREMGVDWTQLVGTGRNGRIREADVRSASVGPARVTSPYAGLPPRRRAIAERLRASRDQTIPVTLTTRADVTKLVRARQHFKQSGNDIIPAITDLLAIAVARALASHPEMAMRWNPERGSLETVSPEAFDIGIAVDTPQGLLVPVLRNVLGKPVESLASESKQAIERARTGRLTLPEMQGAVITLTNLGAQGIDAFTPVINYPEIAIVGVGAIRKEPAFDPSGQVVAIDRMTLSLTFDHAAIDGAPAARFLQTLVATIERFD